MASGPQILHDNGVAYNVQSQGVLRPWELNPIPLCLPAAEWQTISRAVRQRARLLNYILHDLYGDQTLLESRSDRAEFTARIVRCVLEDCSEESGWVEQADVTPLLDTLNHFGQYSSVQSGETLDQCLSRQMAGRSCSGSLVSILLNLRGLAAAARDQISNDAWRVLNILSEDIAFPENLSASEAALHLNSVILALSAFQGLSNEIMPHGHAWRFVDLGRRIERGIYLARLAVGILREEPEPRLGRYELLVKTLDALVTYRQKHASLRAVSVLDLVLCDESNPRSLVARLASSLKHLKLLPRESMDSFKLPEERRLLKALSDVRLLDTEEAIEPRGRSQERQTLAQVERLLCDCSARTAYQESQPYSPRRKVPAAADQSNSMGACLRLLRSRRMRSPGVGIPLPLALRSLPRRIA